MPWVRFDDGFPNHRKVEPLSDGAFRLHSTAIFWSSRQLTDGCIPKRDLTFAAPRTMKRPQKYVSELVEAGLWEDTGEAWQLHDYLDYQPSKEQVIADRAKAAERQKRWRERHGKTRDDSVSNGGSNGVTNGGSNAAPTRPDPSRPELHTDQDDSAAPPPPEKSKKATRIPIPFEVTADMRAWAAEKAPGVDLDSATEEFVDYWRGVSGQRGTKLDWVATWRNRMRDKQERLPRANNVVAIRSRNQAPTGQQDMFAAAYERAAARDLEREAQA
jgi:hypothetical protein